MENSTTNDDWKGSLSRHPFFSFTTIASYSSFDHSFRTAGAVTDGKDTLPFRLRETLSKNLFAVACSHFFTVISVSKLRSNQSQPIDELGMVPDFTTVLDENGCL